MAADARCDDRDVTELIPAERLPARRRVRGAHPAAGAALRQRVLAERGRISRTSRIRELVLGFQDGLLHEEGLSAADAGAAAAIISRSPLAHVKTKVEKELGLPYGKQETALGDALVVGGMYAFAAAIPLWPYFLWTVGTALVVSLVATGLALFTLGAVKGRVVGTALLTSGAQVLLIGGASAAIGWLIGAYVPKLF